LKCKGFLFDLDGTLVDSLPAVERAWTQLAARINVSAHEVLDFIHGKQAITSIRHFMQGASEEAIQQEFSWLEKREAEDIEGVSALPGAIELLTYLNEENIPWAIVTSGTVPIAYARHRAAGLPKTDIFVTAEQVERGKPEPDAYLLGARLLGFEPEQCVVVEDAPAGILSGLAAGCHVIAVNAPADTPRLEHVDYVLSSLKELLVQKTADGNVEILRKH